MKTEFKYDHVFMIEWKDLTIDHVISNLRGNIDYYTPSQDRSIAWNIPDTDITLYISAPLEAGNKKIANNVLVSSLAPVVTCLSCADCKHSCYGRNTCNQYAGALNKRMIYSLMVKIDIDFYFDLVKNQLSRSKKEYIRIHENGDFVNQNYLDRWIDIIRSFPKKHFYFYTKVENILDFSGMEKLKNARNNPSYLPDGELNYGSKEYVDGLEKKYGKRVFICPATMGKKNIHCGGKCKTCINGKREVIVCFYGHGTAFEVCEKEKEKGAMND